MGEKFGLGRHKHNLDGHGGTERLLHPAKLRRRRRMSKQRKGWNGTEAKTGAEKEGHWETGREGRGDLSSMALSAESKTKMLRTSSSVWELSCMTSEVRTEGWSRNEANLRSNIVDSSDRKGEGVNKFPNSVDVKYGSTPSSFLSPPMRVLRPHSSASGSRRRRCPGSHAWHLVMGEGNKVRARTVDNSI